MHKVVITKPYEKYEIEILGNSKWIGLSASRWRIDAEIFDIGFSLSLIIKGMNVLQGL